MPILCLIRHGQSLWNLEDRFTGWVDVPLTQLGRDEAAKAAKAIADLTFQVAYTSALRRAQHTLDVILEANDWPIPVIRDQALNERHYGELQGLVKQELREKFGDEQVKIWRRSYDVPPPGGEALKQTSERTLPFFDRCIIGDIRLGKNVLVVAHGNSNRSIVMQLEKMTPEEILNLNLETGVPIIYTLSSDGAVLGKEVR